jgi:uncharacterized glyoxalase superfamily protein PhnB
MSNDDTATTPTEHREISMVWPCLRYDDAPAAIDFLKKAFGFVDTIVVPGELPGTVAHAELRWPLGGGVMLGSNERPEGGLTSVATGNGWIYVVTDEPDALHGRALAAGATEIRGLEDEDYGSRGFTVTDLEGNYWSFGTYRGE